MARATVLIGSCFLLAAALAACTSSPSSPEEATTCNDLVELAIAAVVDARDSAADVTMQEFQLLDEDAEAITSRLMENRDKLSNRSSQLGCDPTEWEAQYRDRLLKLAPLTEGGLYILQAGLFFSPF